MSVEFDHNKLICEGNCPLAKGVFTEKAISYALKIGFKVCDKFSIPIENISIRQRRNDCFHDARSIILGDPNFGTAIEICGIGFKADEILDHLMEVVKKDADDRGISGSFNEATWLLALLSTRARNIQILQSTLETMKPKPMCVVQSLLYHAVEHFFTEGIKLLLDHGAKLNRSLLLNSSDFLPITFAFDVFTDLVFFRMIDEEKLAQFHCIAFYMIERDLAENGECTNPGVLTHLPDVAIKSERLASLLLDYAIKAMKNPKIAAEVFEGLMWYLLQSNEDPRNYERVHQIINLTNRVILPLMRSGCKHDWSPLKYVDQFLYGNYSKKMSKAIWGRETFFLEMLNEFCIPYEEEDEDGETVIFAMSNNLAKMSCEPVTERLSASTSDLAFPVSKKKNEDNFSKYEPKLMM